MRRLVTIIALAILTCTFAKAEKYALIIAIGNYDQNQTGWYPISSGNDVPLIEKALGELGFPANNITYLRDADATKEGIVNAFTELYAKIGEGDKVVIHYSGHGHQIFDFDGDEIDGLDECLVSYDAPMKMVEGYKGEKHFRDDELGKWIDNFRTKLGATGHILLFLDSCHSGTGTRGSAKVRGGAPPLVPEGWTAKAKTDDKVGFGISSPSSRGAKSSDKLAKFVVFSGASANELNYETTDDEDNSVGSLSYCLYKAFSQMKDGDTYRQVFARIMAEMATRAPFQNPAIEGDVDYKVFGGDFATQSEYFNINSIKSDSVVVINGGRLNGINPGSIIAFVEPGTTSLTDETPCITTGKVIKVDNFRAKVSLEVKNKFKNNQSVWAFVKTRTFSDHKIKVAIDSKMDTDLRSTLEKQISKSGFAEISNETPEITLAFNKTRGAKVISITNSQYNRELHQISNVDSEELAEDVVNTLNNYIQGKIIKDLDYNNSKYDVSMELLPVNAQINDDGSFDVEKYLDMSEVLVNDVVEFAAGDMALIKVRNNGTRKAYFNVIDIQPDGFVNPIIPTVNDLDGREYVVEPGDSAIIKTTLVMFGPPYGNETFKLIASDKPFNLSATIMQHGNSSRGDSANPFAAAIQIGKAGVNSRGASTVSSKTKEEKLSTFEYAFKIVE